MTSRWIFAAAIALILGGCVRSVNPVYLDEQLAFDPALVGKWTDPGAKDVITCAAREDGKSYRIVFIDEKGAESAFIGHLAKVGDLRLLDLAPEQPSNLADLAQAHFLALHSFYRITDIAPSVKFQMMGVEWLKKILSDDPQALETLPLDKDNLVLSNTTQEIQAFILKHRDTPGAWGEVKEYVRVAAASTKPSTLPAGAAPAAK